MEHHHNTTLVSYLYTSPNGMIHKNTRIEQGLNEDLRKILVIQYPAPC